MTVRVGSKEGSVNSTLEPWLYTAFLNVVQWEQQQQHLQPPLQKDEQQLLQFHFQVEMPAEK